MAVLAPTRGKMSRLKRARVLRPLFLLPAAILATTVFMAVFADWLVLHDPYLADLSRRLIPPFFQDGGSLSYPLGTDPLGRDVLSRIILGARVSLSVAVLAIALGGGAGTMLGILAGYYGKKLDSVIMRVCDGMLSFPTIFLALLLAIALGPSFGNIILVISLLVWARIARVVRGEVLSWKARDFVALAKIAGASHFRIMVRHIFPNVLNTAVVMLTLQVGWAIILEATLSFLGAGIPPPSPSWGSMVASGRDYITNAWWVSVFPGSTIFFTVLALNLLGDWVRDILDPKLREV